MADIVKRIEEAFRHDTFWDTDAPPLLSDAVAEIKQLREAIRRLAEQDATLSVQGSNVTVTMDATLTDSERAAIGNMIHLIECQHEDYGKEAHALRNLLERLA